LISRAALGARGTITGMNRTTLAQLVDHTILKPEATPLDVISLCDDAIALQVKAVCVSPSFVPLAVERLSRTGVLVATVAGFPSGKHQTAVKAAEAALAVTQGAAEVDMVIDVGMALSGRYDLVEDEIRALRSATEGRCLKVILETAALSDEAVVSCCKAAEAAGADFVKTSTGFHPQGGATLHAIQLMHRTVGGRLGIKASGGIRDTGSALALIEAGATRLGLSGTKTVLDGLTS
jgi:deoxyribose-phosphate aldolase